MSMNQKITIPCARCGQLLQIHKEQLEKGNHKFCSKLCVNLFNLNRDTPDYNKSIKEFSFHKAGKQKCSSLWEFQRMKDLDADLSVISWKTSERKIQWVNDEGKREECQLNFEIKYVNGITVFEEINDNLTNESLTRIFAIKKFCSKNDILFRIIFAPKQFDTVDISNETYDNDYGVVYRPTFEYIFMQLAVNLAKRSSCLRNKVGVVVTDNKMSKAICIGYNGDHRGGPNQCDSLEPGKCNCIHAEANALIKANESLYDCIMFVTLSPCVVCAKMIVNCGISKVIYLNSYRTTQGIEILKNAGIAVSSYKEFCKSTNKKIAKGLLA